MPTPSMVERRRADQARSRIEARLAHVGRDIGALVGENGTLTALFSERAALYQEGRALGMTQAVLAQAAGSTPGAVEKVLKKLAG